MSGCAYEHSASKQHPGTNTPFQNTHFQNNAHVRQHFANVLHTQLPAQNTVTGPFAALPALPTIAPLPPVPQEDIGVKRVLVVDPLHHSDAKLVRTLDQ